MTCVLGHRNLLYKNRANLKSEAPSISRDACARFLSELNANLNEMNEIDVKQNITFIQIFPLLQKAF